MTYEGKTSTAKWFPVRLVDSTDLQTAETGKAHGDITVTFGYEAATSYTNAAMTADLWKELGNGNYWVKLGAAWSSEGKYIARIVCAGCAEVNFVVEVRDKILAELAETIWDATQSSHTGAGTFGGAIQNVYHAVVDYHRDDDETKDRYTVRWFKNGARVTGGITNQAITVTDATDASTLINAQSMSDVGNGLLLYTAEGDERQDLGTPYEAAVGATIDGSTRTFSDQVGRDI